MVPYHDTKVSRWVRVFLDVALDRDSYDGTDALLSEDGAINQRDQSVSNPLEGGVLTCVIVWLLPNL